LKARQLWTYTVISTVLTRVLIQSPPAAHADQTGGMDVEMMTETRSIPSYLEPTGGWSKFAVDRLLRLQQAIERRRSAERLLSGAQLETAAAALQRAIFSLYLDCVDAGVGEDARRLLSGAAAPGVVPAAASSAASATASPKTDAPDRPSLLVA
jgi:hypothetical protein